MNLSFHIAKRYLFSKKSHNAINLISLISVLGVAAATLAMVCVLSAFNGFQSVLGELYKNFDPDLTITAAEGKSFQIDDRFLALQQRKEVAVYCESIEENCLIRYKDNQTGGIVKGVSPNYDALSHLGESLTAGDFILENQDIDFALVGSGLSSSLGTGFSMIDPISLYAPKRNAKVNLANPAAAFKSERILMSGIFCIGQPEYDDAYVIVPLHTARELFGYGSDEVGSIELRLAKGVRADNFKKELQEDLGEDYVVRDFFELKAEFYRINRVEKWVTYLMLCFILLIALFNVIGSLSMLIIEKQKDVQVLASMGADDGMLKKIFLWEGWMISAIGALTGIILGCLLCWCQQKFGWLKLGDGSFIVEAYPIRIHPADLVFVLITALIVSIPSVWWPVRYIFGKKEKKPMKTGHGTLVLLLFLSVFLWPQKAGAQLSWGGHPYSDSELKAARTRALVQSHHSTVVDLPHFNLDSIRKINADYFNPHGPQPFAHRIPVDFNPDNSGETFYTEDHTRVWRLHLRSEGAYSLNIVFEKFRIPPGAELFLYNPDRSQVLGAYTERNMQAGGEFPIEPVDGDELIIEYHEPDDALFRGELQIYGINHDYLGLRVGRKFNYLKMPCLPHLSCHEEYAEIGRSVCLLIVDGKEYCTGVFVNNSSLDGRPFLLTAGHCFDNENPELGARTLVFMNYESPRCLSQIQGSEEFSLSGCVTRAIAKDLDFALLELEQMPPADYRPYLAGWDIRTDSSAQHQSPFVCIHHPYGEVKRFAVENDSLGRKSWPQVYQDDILDGIHWHIRQWETGHTWSGSSGSPLFNKDFHLVGTLTGGDSGGNNGCSEYETGDFFVNLGQIWDYYPEPSRQLKHWLDPGDTQTLVLDGADPWKEHPSYRLSNIHSNDSIEDFHIPSYGYLLGHNADQYSFAEEFHTDSTVAILGLYLMAAKGTYNIAQPIYLDILDGDYTDSVLASAVMNPSYLDYKSRKFFTTTKNDFSLKENFIRFDSAVFVGNHFIVRCITSYPSRAEVDTFALFGARTSVNTALFNDHDVLTAFPHHKLSPHSLSAWIEPLVQYAKMISPVEPTPVQNAIQTAYSPTGHFLHLVLPDNWTRSFQFELIDCSGKKVLSKRLLKSQNGTELPEGILKGLYIIQLYDNLHHYHNKIMIY